MALTLASILAGLGLFFVGKDLLTGNLRNMVGRSVQLTLSRVAAFPMLGLFWGAVLGAMIQSTAIVTFILVGLLTARMIEPRRALPMLMGGNIGSALILLLVTLDIRIVVMLALGVTGILLTHGRLQHWKAALSAIFGLCLLYYGLVLLKAGTVPLAQSDGVMALMAGLDGSLAAAFLIGAALSAACQSSITVALLGRGFLGSGLFSFEQAMLVIYGTNLGSGIVTYLLAGGVQGTARRMALFQLGFNLTGCVLLLALFASEHVFGVPLVMALLRAVSSDVPQQLALSYLVFNSVTALFLFPLIGLVEQLLARRCPPSPQESDSQLAYLSPETARDPATAILLVEKEQARLLERLPRYAELLRQADTPARKARLEALHKAFVSVHDQTKPYIAGLAEGDLTADSHEHVYRIVDRHDRLGSIESVLYEFAAAAPLLEGSTALAAIREALTEGLDALLLSYVEAMAGDDPDDLALIERITGDRGELMEGVRRSFFSDAALKLGRDEKMGLLQLTGLFERLVWLLREMALKAPFEAGTRPAPEAAE